MALTEQNKRFVREWLIDYNATQAAIRAGYSKHSAHAQGYRLLNHAEVIEYMTNLQSELNERLTITREQVIEEMAKVALMDIRKLFNANGTLKPICELDDQSAAAVASIEVVTNTVGKGEDADVEYVNKIKLNPKMTALDQLSRHFNLYKDHEESGAGQMTVIIEGKDALL